jgi:hypothetical protein
MTNKDTNEGSIRFRIHLNDLKNWGISDHSTENIKHLIQKGAAENKNEDLSHIYDAIQNLTLLCSNFFSILTTANADQLVLMEREYEAHKDYSATKILRNIGEILMKTSIIKATHLKKIEPVPFLTLNDLTEREGAFWKYLESIPREKAQNFLDKMAKLDQKTNQEKNTKTAKKPLPDKSKGGSSRHDYRQQELI